MRLRVGTFNVRRCEGADGRVDVSRTAEVIAQMDADVVALQELDRGLPRSGGADQPAELAAQLGFTVAFFPTITRADGEYGIAVASRLPLEKVGFVRLPQRGNEEERGAIVSRSGDCRLIATHISTDRGVRRLQLDALFDLGSSEIGPSVVLGDLNTTAAGLREFLTRGWSGAFGHRTLLRGLGRRQIDHVLVSPGSRIVRAWTLRTDCSDHLPLVADVDFS